MLNDLRYGVRTFRKSPGFTVVAVLTLALGIGANTAIFSVVNAVLLRSLPYKDPERLVRVWERNPQEGIEQFSISPANFLAWSKDAELFDQIAAWQDQNLTLTRVEEPERLRGKLISRGFFQIFSLQPMLGRTFLSDEEQPGHDQVVLLTYRLWKKRFGGDPKLLGQSLTLDGKSYKVIGVLPPDFRSPDEFGAEEVAQLLVPLTFDSVQEVERGLHFLQVVARLKATRSLSESQAKMETIARQLEKEYPDSNKGWGVRLVPLQQDLVKGFRLALLVLLGAVALVLLIACANVANLLLIRATLQHREMAIRAALGASRLRLVRQLLIQSAQLALLSGLLGSLLALWGTDFLLSLAPKNIPRLYEAGMSGPVLGFALSVSLLTVLIFGLAPALQVSKPDLNLSLKETGRVLTWGSAHTRSRNVLVIVELTLSLVLLTGAGLLVKSFWVVQSVDPGYRPESLLAMTIEPPPSKYREFQQRAAFFEQVLQRVEALPGVRSAAVATNLPLRGSYGGTFSIEGRPLTREMDAEFRAISPNYFDTMKIPLLQGRPFAAEDSRTAMPVAIVNRTMERRFFQGESPIGKRIKQGPPEFAGVPWLTIVGVVGDIKYELTDMPFAEVFVPYLQPASVDSTFWPRELVVRSDIDPASLASALRREVWAVDKDQPVANIRTLEQLLADSLSPRRFNMLLLSLFSVIGLFLVAVGIYGVLSYSVAQRTHELGIRLALGAERKDILWLTLRQGLGLVSIGLALGFAGALMLTRLLSSLLYGVTPTDPVTFLAASLLFGGVALLACYIPARKATKVDPMVALRHE